MVRVSYPHRLLLDYHFFEWLSTCSLDESEKIQLIRQLMYVKATSIEHKKEHNVMLDFHFDKTVSKLGYDKNFLGGCVKRIDEPDFLLDTKDEISKVIKYGIYLANDMPHLTIIFTSPAMIETYSKNQHLKDVKSVIVKTDSEAINLIHQYFRLFTSQRN